MKILVVDDSKAMVAMIKLTLEKAGHEVATGSTGVEGLLRLDEAGGDVDLIICDLNMPEMDGLDMLRKVRESEAGRRIPFMMLTTEIKSETRQQAKEAGASAWMIKPFNEEQILDAVNRLLR